MQNSRYWVRKRDALGRRYVLCWPEKVAKENSWLWDKPTKIPIEQFKEEFEPLTKTYEILYGNRNRNNPNKP